MRSISRSSHETFLSCPRKGYLQYLYRGTGVVTKIPDWALVIGSALHEGLEHLMRFHHLPGCVDGAVEVGRAYLWKAFSHLQDETGEFFHHSIEARLIESCNLVEAFLRGWSRVRLPNFLLEFEILSIELETPVLLSSDLRLNARADVVVRSKTDGQVYVFNWKSSSKKDLDQWDHDIQMWTEALATEGTIGEPVVGCIVELFYKGQRKFGLQLSPLIYAYVTKNGDVATEWSKGSTRVPVWELSGGVKKWVEETLPLDILSGQFLRTPPIQKNNDVVHDWLEQTVHQERTTSHVIAEGTEREKELHFWQRFHKETCPWCPFDGVCGRKTDIQALLDAGVLVPRVDHHA